MSPIDFRTRRKPNTAYTAVVANDFHFPYICQPSFILWLSFLRWLEPDEVVINGDGIDLSPISRFMKSPIRANDLQADLDGWQDCLRRIRKAVGPDCKIVYNEGNHEQWLTKYLWSTAKGLSFLRAMQIEKLLGFEEIGIRFIPYEGHHTIGDMIVHHGEAANKYSAAKNVSEVWNANGISGHTHRLWSFPKRTHSDDLIWYENGCMCSFDVAKSYKKTTPNWQKGFSVLTVHDGRTWVEQVRIREGRVGSPTIHASGSDIRPAFVFRGQVFKIEKRIG